MCDDRTAAEDEAYLRDKGVSRRAFGVISAAALAACASTGDGGELVESEVDITTPEGTCDAHFVHPARGRHPAVLVWPDIMGLRPAFRTMGRRLAQSGYAVLTVNPFYRLQRAPILAEGQSFTDPEVRQRLIGVMRGFTQESQTSDANAMVAWLDAQSQVDTSRKIGTTGYCMGGSFVMRTAAALPARVGAGASFHGGGLAVADNPQSPHLLIPRTQANFLIAIAQNDDEGDPTTKETLRQAFVAAARPAEIEVYPARHGWCVVDNPVYDHEQAERAWTRLLALLSAAAA